MTDADLRTVAIFRAGRVLEAAPDSRAAREIARVLFERSLDRLETTPEILQAMGHWSPDVIARELPHAEALAQRLATQFAVV